MPKHLWLATALVACGCAHHKANQYSYAPPLMPPAYPQPQMAAQPVAYPGAAVPGPAMAAPMAAVPGPAPAMAAPCPPGVAAPAYAPAAAAPMAGGVVPALADGSCPPCAAGHDGAVPVVYEGGMQTMPCPAGP
ncbi:MAG: hypothetical protein RLZZ440_2504 [Planctomycetota bacterium]